MASPVSGIPQSWRAYEEELARHARLAEAVRCRRLKISADQQAPAVPWDEYLDQFWASVATGLAATPSVTSVVIENHIGRANALELLSSAERSGDPRFGCAFSCAHALVMQEDTLALIDRYARRIHTVCFSDRAVPRGDEVGRYDGRYYHVRFELAKYGEGMVQSGRMLAELGERGFGDYVAYKCEESSRPGDLISSSEDLIAGFPDFIRGLGASVQ
jgi:sugar phosphate isomerase/epimerase